MMNLNLFNRYKIEKNSRFLELGCGRGEFLNEFIELGVQGYGLDISDYSKKNVVQSKIYLIF
mgnify:CR=1 FL=1